MASLDTARPAAQEQLAILGAPERGGRRLPIVEGEKALEITRRALRGAARRLRRR